MTTDLTGLPDITFADSDAGNVEASVIETYEALTGRTLYAGDPVRLFLEALAYVIAQQRAVIDYTGKQNLLRYATGDYLDHLGALTGVNRLSAAAATCTVRFLASAVMTTAAPIPAGTRVSTSGGDIFATTAAAEIAIGSSFVDVTVEADTAGAALNGLLAGQINLIVDPVAYVASAVNTDTTTGGADIEDDESLRERIRISPESYSVAGPSLAYVYWAKSASSAIADVSVTSPTPGMVDIRVLLENGVLPGAEVLALVESTVAGSKCRPLTDQVQVAAPETASFDVALTWYCPESKSSLAASIQAAVASAIADYVSWQTTVIGRDINPSELISRIMAAGAKRVEVTSPVFTALGETAVAALGAQTVIYGGVEAA